MMMMKINPAIFKVQMDLLSLVKKYQIRLLLG